MPNHGNFEEDIEALIGLTIDAIHKPNVLKGILILASEIVSDDNELIKTSRYFRAPYAQLMGTIIQRAEQRGEIIEGLNPKHLAQMVSGTILQFAISKKPGRRKAKKVILEMLKLLLLK